MIFQPEICQYQQGQVEVELLSPRLAGMTSWYPAAEPQPHRIAVEVDVERFFTHYFAVVSGKEPGHGG